jgi:hypothetical protein
VLCADPLAQSEPTSPSREGKKLRPIQISKSDKRTSTIPRRDASELCKIMSLEEQRAQGKPGARCTRSRVRSGRKHTR